MFQFSSRRNQGRQPYQPRPPEGSEDDSQLDWAFGEAAPPNVIDLSPSRQASERDHTIFQPRPLPKRNVAPSPTSYPSEQPASAAVSSLTAPYRGSQAATNLQALEEALDKALDDWWSEDKIPSKALLREGLLALKAGHDLDEGHRTLLLRTALARRRGILTALQHQRDGDRTAFLLKGAILDIHNPLPPVELARLQHEDENSEAWITPLKYELQDEIAAVTGLSHELAKRALAVLEGKPPPPALSIKQRQRIRGQRFDYTDGTPPGSGYWSPGRRVLFLLLVGCLLFAFVQPGNSAPVTQVTIPTGDYLIHSGDEAEPTHQLSLAEFLIDRNEVTNGNYRQCVELGLCSRPSSFASINHPDYFTHPQYNHHPVVNVTYAQAEQFCQWLGKRLPTADEWTVAASIAPNTQRANRYPWGNLYEPQRANLHESGWGETRPVGSYSPFGDSSFGLADMAGNVAEWTATPAGGDDERMIVKGGSFLDGSAHAVATAVTFVDATAAEPWLGFRCVVDGQ